MTNILNNGAPDDDAKEGDGVALYSTRHPLLITDEMLHAGAAAYYKPTEPVPSTTPELKEMLRAVYTAMSDAQPPPLPADIDEDAITTMRVRYTLPDDAVEKFAMRIALGNNGGEWLKTPDGQQHYTEEQKEHWRQLVRELADDVRHAHQLQVVDEDPGTEF